VFRRFLVPALAVLVLVSSATAVMPAAAETHKAVVTHKLIVAVTNTLVPATQKKLAVLVLVSQGAGAPAGAVAAPTKPLTVLLDNRGVYRVKAEIDASCKGSCSASYRLSGSVNHKLKVVPSCRPNRPGVVCSRVTIVKVY